MTDQATVTAVVTAAGIVLVPSRQNPHDPREETRSITFTSSDEELEAERCHQADALTACEQERQKAAN